MTDYDREKINRDNLALLWYNTDHDKFGFELLLSRERPRKNIKVGQMRRSLFILVLLFLVSSAQSATVAWDVFQYGYNATSKSTFVYSGGIAGLDVHFNVISWGYPGERYIWAEKDNGRQGSLAPVQSWNSGAWLEASFGDLVDYETVMTRDEYWFYEMAKKHPNTYGFPKEVNPSESYYLMFAIEDIDDAWAYRLDETIEDPKLYYGWLEYTVDDDGKFIVKRSAIDFDGGPMIVGMGAIPEPTSAILLLFGLSLLAIKRPAAMVSETRKGI